MTKSAFPNPLEIYSPILIFSAATLIALTSSRLLLTALYWSRVEAVDGFYFIILQGIRFDFIIVCALVVPVTILQPFLRDRAVFRQVSQLYLLFSFVVIVFMEAATPTFIGEYDQRPNILFVEYLKYPKEVALMLWGGFKLDITIGLICVVALAWAFNKFLSPAMKKSTVPTFFQAILYSMIVMSICFIGIRSSFGHRPANPAKVAFSVDLLANDLALNSIYSTAYAIYSSIRHERDVQAYGKMEMESVLQLIHDDMALPKSEFLSRDLPTLHRSQWVTPKEKPMNLVIILQESLGAEFVGALGGTDVTPELDALSTQGIWFNNLYATGTRSVRGIEAITTGFKPTPAPSVLKLPKS